MAGYPNIDKNFIASDPRWRGGYPGPSAAQQSMTHWSSGSGDAGRSVADIIARPYANVAPTAAEITAGSQGRVDAARTAAMSDYQKYGQMKDSRDFADTPNAPSKSNGAYSGMESTIGRRFANGYAPSAAEEAAAQAAQAAEIQQRRVGVQNAWLKQQGIPEYARLGTPDTNRLPQTARPGSTTEVDYGGGFQAPGTRIFGTADKTGRVNSFTGAGLPSMESVGGGSGSHTQKVGAMLAQMSEKLAGMSGATDVRSMMERKSLRRSIAELSGVHNTLAGFEHGMASVGETTRGKKQSERATASAQAFALPTTSEQLIRLQAMREGPDTMREYAAAVHGGYAQPKTMPMSPLGMFTPGAMPTYYGSPEVGANIDAMNVYPYAR